MKMRCICIAVRIRGENVLNCYENSTKLNGGASRLLHFLSGKYCNFEVRCDQDTRVCKININKKSGGK